MAALSYMLRRGGTYWFRKKLPLALAGKDAPAHVRAAFPELVNLKTGCFKLELTASLGTKNPTTAKRLDLQKAEWAFGLLEDAMRLMNGEALATVVPAATDALPSPTDIELEFVSRLLADDEAERQGGDPKRDYQTEEDRDEIRQAYPGKMGPGLLPLGPAQGMETVHHIAMEDLLTEQLAILQDAYARRDVSCIEGEAQVYLKRRGLRYDQQAHYHSVGLPILRGHLRAIRLMLQRHGGEVIDTPPPPATAQGPSISEALANWGRGSQAKGGKKPSPRTVQEAEKAVRRFKELHGDMRLSDIKPPHARQLREALEKVPTRLTGKRRTMELKALIDAPAPEGSQTARAETVNKQLTLIRAVISRAMRDGELDHAPTYRNPFEGISSAVDDRQVENRQPFSGADLKAIFSSPVYASGSRPRGGAGEAAYWLPLMALFTGARLAELAQLRASDLKFDEDTGVWHLEIGVSGGRGVKTASSRRKVPLHSELIRLGLLRYREARSTESAEASLWPDLKAAPNRAPGASFTQWFGRHLRMVCGVAETGKVFHSFRHTFKRLLRDADIGEELSDALTGHSGGGVGRGYGDGFGLKALEKGLARIEVPAAIRDLKGLKAEA